MDELRSIARALYRRAVGASDAPTPANVIGNGWRESVRARKSAAVAAALSFAVGAGDGLAVVFSFASAVNTSAVGTVNKANSSTINTAIKLGRL